jgi:hypothetical protein
VRGTDSKCSVEKAGCLQKVTQGRNFFQAGASSIAFQDVTGYQTEIQLLQCTLNSSLPAKWFFGDKEINKENFSILKFEAREDKNNVRTLIIKNIRSQDYGQYSVEGIKSLI